MMKMQRIRLGGMLIAALALATACAHTPMPYKTPISATPPSGRLAVSQAVNLFDASGSREMSVAGSRATFESIVGVMPNGRYSAGNVVFGGFDRESTGMSEFSRGKLAASAKNAAFLEGSTPIFEVIQGDLAGSIRGTSGRAAVVLISDGLATDYVGRSGVDDMTVEAARRLVGGRPGETCFHTIQAGNDPAGAALLRSLSDVSACGSFRNASSLNSAAALQQFSREVYLGGEAAPPADGDSDRDGVSDSADACPNTLRNARVDARGCWTLHGIRFAVNSADLAGDSKTILKEDLAVLRSNPGVRIRVDGHTDSDGSEAYNMSLSERRASSVRDYFVEEGGLQPGRFQIKGFGESAPIAPNDGAANKRRNRRVELTVID
jgi:OOP family OmpA-OmpF porin